MNRFKILTYDGLAGYVEVADDLSVEYDYTGRDPDGEIESFLEEVAAGERTWYVSNEETLDSGRSRLSASEKLLEIAAFLRTFDPIFGCKRHPDFDSQYGR